MLFIGAVATVNYTAKNIDGGTQSNKIQYRINPMHKSLKNAELPIARPLVQLETEMANLKVGDLVYLYTEDNLMQNVYYIGRVNSSIDLSKLLDNVTKINYNIAKPIKKLSEYKFTGNLKIMCYGNQLLFMNGEENFTVIADKGSGNVVSISSTEVKMQACNTDGTKITKVAVSDGDVKIYTPIDGTVTLYANTIMLNAVGSNPSVIVGGAKGYIVTSPSPGMSVQVNGMALTASTFVKGG